MTHHVKEKPKNEIRVVRVDLQLLSTAERLHALPASELGSVKCDELLLMLVGHRGPYMAFPVPTRST